MVPRGLRDVFGLRQVIQRVEQRRFRVDKTSELIRKPRGDSVGGQSKSQANEA